MVSEENDYLCDIIPFRWVLKISFELLLGYFRADLVSSPPKRSEPLGACDASSSKASLKNVSTFGAASAIKLA